MYRIKCSGYEFNFNPFIKNYLFIVGFVFNLLYLPSCITIPNQHVGFPPGIWRGMIYINEYKDIIVTEGLKEEVNRDVNYESRSKFIPFNFEVVNDSSGKQQIVVMNASERIIFNDIKFGRDLSTGKDTFIINLTPYDAILKGVFQEDKMRGYYIVKDKTDYFMPFEAKFGQAHRFVKLPAKAEVSMNGSFQMVFSDTLADRYDAIGEFVQEGSKLTGTIRTETGDYRFLEGNVEANKFSLSTFDGAHVFLFEGVMLNDSINGIFYSGKKYKTDFKGRKANNGILKSASEIIHPKTADALFKFRFNTPEGKMIDFDSPELRHKVKLVQIMGTWCPNCRDESQFLIEYLKKNSHPDLFVVGVAFERYADREKAKERIRNYKSSMNLPYDLVYGGRSNKDSAAIVFPELSGIASFPTSLVIDRKNKIAKIYTGFDGPATSKYEDFKIEFKNTLTNLLDKK